VETSTDKLFIVPEAAEFLRISVSTLERFRQTGEGPPYVKLGGRVLYREQDLEEYIKRHVIRSTAEWHAKRKKDR
jgi:excisionase family DNA binding protein